MLLPFRSRAIAFFSVPTLVSGEFHDYDAILFLFGDVAIEWRLNIHDETARTKKKSEWIIHPLASTSITVKNWAANVHDR